MTDRRYLVRFPRLTFESAGADGEAYTLEWLALGGSKLGRRDPDEPGTYVEWWEFRTRAAGLDALEALATDPDYTPAGWSRHGG